jgi:hypothetical protein
MAKDYKYEDSTPVDEPIPKGKVKAVEPGSGIRVDKFSKEYTPNARSQPILPNSAEDDSLEDKFARKKRGADLSSSTLRLMAKQAKPENIGRLNQKADAIQNQYDYDLKKAKGELTPQNTPENKDVSDMSYKKGGMTASSRADGCCTKGKTRGKVC